MVGELPAEIQPGDLLVAIRWGRPMAYGTLPPGWSQVRSAYNSAGSYGTRTGPSGVAIDYKIAEAGEVAPSITHPGGVTGGPFSIALFAFRANAAFIEPPGSADSGSAMYNASTAWNAPATGLSVEAGDLVVVANSLPDAATAWSGQSLVADQSHVLYPSGLVDASVTTGATGSFRALIFEADVASSSLAFVSTLLAPSYGCTAFMQVSASAPVLSWDAPASDGGSPLTGYVLRIFDGVAVVEHKLGADVTTFQMPKTPGGSVQLAAVNAVGESAPIEMRL